MNTDSPLPWVRALRLNKTVTSPEGALVILHEVDVSIARGEAVAIVGASGSGKSTLLGLLAGLDLPTHGEVWLGEDRLDTLNEDARARLRSTRVGFVFQSFQLLPHLNALENVMLPLELAARTDARRDARSALERVGLNHRLTHYPSQLSGGEQQRVAIARAYATHPQVLFADEPTGNLDRSTGTRIIDLLFDIQHEHGTTLVLVSHDEALARRCDRRIELVDGTTRACT